MTKWIAAFGLLLPIAALAGEHPKEHPSAPAPKAQQEHPEHPHEHPSGKAHEHPAGHEHPVGSKHWTKQMNKEFNQVVEDYVQKNAANTGFKVRDDKLGKEWFLALLRVHKDRIVHLGNNRFFACADFKSTMKGQKDKLDLDFYATKSNTGWIVDQILIHKVNGKARYTYNDKNEIVPVK